MSMHHWLRSRLELAEGRFKSPQGFPLFDAVGMKLAGGLPKSFPTSSLEPAGPRPIHTDPTTREYWVEKSLFALQALQNKRASKAPAARASSSPPPVARPQAVEFALPGSCAAETRLLPCHVPKPSEEQLKHAATQVARDGYGKIRLGGEIVRTPVEGAHTAKPTVTAGNLAVELDAIRAAGARAVLLVVNSNGGDVRGGLGIVRALRRFSDEVGPVVAYVKKAESMACSVAVAADFVVADPDSTWADHHAVNGSLLNQSVFDFLCSRVLLSPEKLLIQIDAALRFSSHDAMLSGFADEVGDFERAHQRAYGARNGYLLSTAPHTFRQQVLAERKYEKPQ